MSQITSAIATSDELSSEIATAILTRQKELNRDPQELLQIVLTVHNTLRDLSAKPHQSRYAKAAHVASATSDDNLMP